MWYYGCKLLIWEMKKAIIIRTFFAILARRGGKEGLGNDIFVLTAFLQAVRVRGHFDGIRHYKQNKWRCH